MIKAPFILHTVAVPLHTGQAQGDKWYLAPFKLCKIRLFWHGIPTWAMRWTYDRPGQYLGNMSEYGGKQSWRRS